VKRFAILVVLLLLFSLVLVSLLQIEIAKAEEETIYIRADGTVKGTDKIQRVGNIFTFTDDISTGRYTGAIELDVDGLIIERDNIVVDGAGYALQAVFPTIDAGAGIILSGRSNVTLKNIQIKDYATGIHFVNSSNCKIQGNNIDTVFGISIRNSSSNIITGNRMTDGTSESWYGMSFYHSSDNVISGNNITNNSYYGVWLENSSNNIFFQNNFLNNSIQIGVEGSINVWDDDVSGNYWGDYKGTDGDEDGIGDTPYVIDENNQDNYPLMNPVDITTIPEFPSWTILPIFTIATLLIIICKQKLPKNRQPRQSY